MNSSTSSPAYSPAAAIAVHSPTLCPATASGTTPMRRSARSSSRPTPTTSTRAGRRPPTSAALASGRASTRGQAEVRGDVGDAGLELAFQAGEDEREPPAAVPAAAAARA